jgi:catechol 2,3-dioxygenase-like lactoylglutathione lyase family enzyme
MHVIGLDHMVVNTHNLEQALHFYRDVLGLELLRLEEFRAGKVGFVSARVSPETIIDIRPIPAGERVTPNMDHYCLVLRPTDMHQLHAELKAQGIKVEETVRPAWGAQGSVANFHWRQVVVWSLPVTCGLKQRRATRAVSCKGAHFPKDIILMGVRWAGAYPLS